jgi:hypothetical protein
MSYGMIKDDLKNLEKITEFENYTFGISHRIYYKNNSLIYIPNHSNEEARKFHFTIFKTFFDIAYNKVKNVQD